MSFYNLGGYNHIVTLCFYYVAFVVIAALLCVAALISSYYLTAFTIFSVCIALMSICTLYERRGYFFNTKIKPFKGDLI